MKIIDTHVHPCFSNPDIKEAAATWGVDFTPEGLENDMLAARVDRIVAIPDVREVMKSNHELEEFASSRRGNILTLFGVPPEVPSNLERQIENGRHRGIKLFPGYQPRYISDRAWRKVFHVATEMRIPVVIHTGDVYAFHPGLKVKYAHPLPADDVASDFPECTIVLAHTGNPWVADACEVAYKNDNVFVDLSAWWIGRPDPLVARVMSRQLEYVISFIGSKKALFATDWPLMSMLTLKRFIDRVNIPGKQDIFSGNAKRVFWGD